MNSVTGQKDSVCVTGQGDLDPAPVVAGNSKLTLNLNVDSHVANAHIVTGLPQSKGVNPNPCQIYTEIKYLKDVSCVGLLPHAVLNPPVGARLNLCWEKWEALGSTPKVVTTLREGYVLPFRFRPNLTRSPTVISKYHNPTKQSFLVEALYQLINKNAVEPVENQKSLGFYNRLFLVPKPNNQWRPVLDLSILNTFLTRVFQDGDPRDHNSLPTGRGVGHIHRLQRRILLHTNSQSVQEVYAFSHTGSVLPVQSPTLWSVHSSNGVHSGGQRGQVDGTSEGYKDPPVLRRLAGESLYPRHLPPAYSNPGHALSRTRVAGEQEVRTGPQTGFQLRSLPVRPETEQGQTNRGTVCPVRQFMSLIGLLTATEKQVHLGQLHMRPIEWHLKNNWRVPESLEKVIPVPKSLHPHLRLWLEESNVLLGQPLHPLKHALQIFTDASKEGWGAHLDKHTARGTWSLPESKLHINHLELKAVFLALKQFRTLVYNKTVLIATDNTTVVAYINKEGGG